MNAVDRFIKKIAQAEFANVFNPYAQRCPIFDVPDAPKIRRENLRLFLTAVVAQGGSDIWLGRDLGYRGGRRTGLALTDEVRLPMLGSLVGRPEIRRATKGDAVSERTATVIWDLIQEIGRVPFLWNAFPFHPYEVDEPFSNRCHTRAELKQAWEINEALFEILQPSRFIGIGNDAVALLQRQGIKCEYIRHPSYGGQTECEAGIRTLYNLVKRPAKERRSRNDQQCVFSF